VSDGIDFEGTQPSQAQGLSVLLLQAVVTSVNTQKRPCKIT